MVLIREEGWKEVKVVAVSEVKVDHADTRARETAHPSRRDHDAEYNAFALYSARGVKCLSNLRRSVIIAALFGA
jgi:hypothetical protein